MDTFERMVLWTSPVGAIGLAAWLLFSGPAEIHDQARRAFTQEQRRTAYEMAAELTQTLQAVSDHLSNPVLRAASGIETAADGAAMTAALDAMKSGLLARLPAILLIHDGAGDVRALNSGVPADKVARLLAHRHHPQDQEWSKTGEVGLCAVCFAKMHALTVKSPLADGWFLSAIIPAQSIAQVALSPFSQEPGRAAWLLAPDQRVVAASGDTAPPAPDNPDWVRARTPLTGWATGWTAVVAAKKSHIAPRIRNAVRRLMGSTIGIAVLLGLLLLVLTVRARRRQRVWAERQEAMIHQEKLMTLGAVSGHVAHELRNQITLVTANLELALDLPVGDDGRQECLDDAGRAAGRLLTIADDLRRYGRADPKELRRLPLAQPVEEAVRMLRPLLKHGPEVRVSCPSDLMVAQSPGRLVQVLVNLLKNAAEAMPNKDGVIRIRATRGQGQIRLTVTDQGSGIPVEALDHVFEPFFTTKGREQGTGLGLSVCADVIRQHGGTLHAENLPIGGARLTITLPAAPAPPAQAELALACN